MLTLSWISLVCCSTYPEPYKYLSAYTLVYTIFLGELLQAVISLARD
jgi:hypothetical protein